ncbi:MAG: flippase-like domain-containing protein, partial [Actinobacteria bacterium]|nr:flippase-like domain-containing protein [Actinomycetota bacterium]
MMGSQITARWWVAAALVAGSAALVAAAVDVPTLAATLARAAGDPAALGLVLLAYLLAFVTRAALWSRVLPSLPFPQALAAIHVSLAANHLLPLRLGEALRVTSVVRRAGLPVAAATASTVNLRAADVLAVVGLGAVLGPRVLAGTVGPAGWLLAVPAAALWCAAARWLRRAAGVSGTAVRGSGVTVGAGATLAWLLESAVVWQAAHWAGAPIGVVEAVLVTAVTIAAQVVAVAPGGLGTYEAAATAAMAAVGVPTPVALAAAVTAHAVKTAYALAAGAVAAVVPAPGLAGRLRLPRAP